MSEARGAGLAFARSKRSKFEVTQGGRVVATYGHEYRENAIARAKREGGQVWEVAHRGMKSRISQPTPRRRVY